VPDARLDRLTAMFNPKKRVPATIEFTDLATPGGTGGFLAAHPPCAWCSRKRSASIAALQPWPAAVTA
jgi:hypothetical protein